ncbi:FabD/lysophospholipase-like protein [Lojkania enalia]|uniref:FabD/lysophospholipase-like protein n=1 Tax=Lojkania enalia TaxID=147567 RepID=A0A9P4K036_9PLEO|nr:FabD/lysophospholipase-like protein [Didymosphaeria enalia]
MLGRPWISIKNVENETTLWVHDAPFSSLCSSGAENAQTSLITLVGRKKKATLLNYMLKGSSATASTSFHGQVRLVKDTKIARSDAYVLYLDCELQGESSPSFDPKSTPCSPKPVSWLRAGDHTTVDLPNLLVSRVLTPLSNVVCYFAADFGGIVRVANLLAQQAVESKSHTLPGPALPHILVVVETKSPSFDPVIAQQKLHATIAEAMAVTTAPDSGYSADGNITSHFQSIQILSLHKDWDNSLRSLVLRRRLLTLAEDIQRGRRTSHHQFSVQHIDAFADRILTHFCLDKSRFSFLRASRPANFVYNEFQTHITEILSLIPSQSWLWEVIIPLIASALFLASYPPGSHRFSAQSVFDEFYNKLCKRAIESYTNDNQIQHRFISAVGEEMAVMLRKLDSDPVAQSALKQHSERLRDLWPHFPLLKSSKSCFSCFMLMPEKVFNCRHAICNICIQRFGQKLQSEKHSYIFSECLLCGYAQKGSIFRLTPPTVGIRILCIDGGGIRGVVPLTFVQYLERELKEFGIPFQEFFDYVCGTSAGGLIAIGLFLMRWTPRECLMHFEDFASKTFMQKKESLSFTQRVQRLLGAYVRDYRYDSSTIGKAFCSASSTSSKMFNPLRNDMKIAVTTTTARHNVPCVLSNYNGGPRNGENIYHHVRAGNQEDEISISDAAVCTSAAPFFFKPKDVNNLGTFQDGGLEYNNPAFIATWECAVIWPDRCHILEQGNGYIDYMLSLGTGTSLSPTYKFGPHSPVRDRFLKRLMGNYMGHLDGEKQWKTFIKCIPADLRNRYYRFNIYFPGPEPALDDVLAIQQLKRQADQCISSDIQARLVKDSLIASMFYFELISFHQLQGGAIQCTGTILCRIRLDYGGRKKLYHLLARSCASFIISGRSIDCFEVIPKGMPAFRRSVDFVAKGLNDPIYILLEGITSRPTLISGMPRPVHQLIEAQGLQTPFGCIDHREVEKPLPRAQSKRKLHEI